MRDRINADRLLAWYDAHARDLPWRIPPERSRAGDRPDPYHIWLSEVMLQQTTVAAVIPYFEHFTQRWPTVEDLAAAEDADVMGAWAGLGYYARARNLLKCARAVAAGGGTFPGTQADLAQLPGIGPYTAAAVAAIAFGRRAVVVDGNVERVMARIHDVETPLPDAKPLLRELADAATPDTRPGDYAQAVMDLGATVCTPRSPSCGTCPWADGCAARKAGTAATRPRKRPKAPKPVRHGIAYLGRRTDGALLLETRPDTGLLGGMLSLPGSVWVEGVPTEAPPIDATWTEADTNVRHTFTHFHLVLQIMVAEVAPDQTPTRGTFAQGVRPGDLPTVMRKALRAGLDALERANG